MTRITEHYTPREIMYDERLKRLAHEEMLHRNRVLDNVNEILTFHREGFINIKRVAELYQVEESKVFKLLEVPEELAGEINLLVSKNDMLNVGFSLTDSDVAKELRKQVRRVEDIA